MPDAASNTVKLSTLKRGSAGVIGSVDASPSLRQRLFDMGLLPGVSVTLIRVAPTGQPMWIKVHGSEVGLRKNEAEALSILVEEVATRGDSRE